MPFHDYPNIHRISLSCILFVMLFCLPAAADMPQTPALFQWELDQNLADDGTMGSALVDQASISYVAGEPDPPGYGTHGASFDGSTDHLSLDNAVVGNRACNGTDHEATFYADVTLGSVSTTSQYIIAKYAATSGGRQLAPIYHSETGEIGFLWGYNGGNSYQSVEIDNKTFGSEHLSVALSIDVAAKTYTLLVREWDSGTYWVKTQADEALTGTYNSGTYDLNIGARSDSNRFFSGIVWRAAIYDERHTRAEMEAVIVNGDPAEPIVLTLINAATEQDIVEMQDGATIAMDQVGTALNVRATIQNLPGHDKVRFELDGVEYRIEADEPYALAGNESGDYLSWTPEVGNHSLKAIVLDANDVELSQRTISFSVTHTTPTEPIVFTLINASTEQAITELQDGAAIALDQVGEFLNVRATVQNLPGHDKVRFELDGVEYRIEADEPYALAGNEGSDYLSWTPEVGSHSLKAIVYDANDVELSQRTISFSVTHTTPTEPIVFTLINASTEQDIAELQDGADVAMDQVGEHLNVRATVQNITGHAKVRFELDGVEYRIEADEPYALAGNEGSDYLSWTPAIGSHSLKAIVYDANEVELAQRTISFNVTHAGALFDKARGDLISLHFDHRADPDDGHATVADLAIVRYYGLSPIVVSGAYGWQPGEYQIASEAVTTAAWGSDWLNAHADWSGAVAAAAHAWNAALGTGAHVWIAEGGQSDFSADVVRRLQQIHSISSQVTKTRIHLVQHSVWNENYTRSAEHNQTDNLGFVRINTDYVKIPDGNFSGNGSADLHEKHANNAVLVDTFVQKALAHPPTRRVWQAAFDYLDPISQKLDFSDAVELLYILGIGTDVVNDCSDFADYFLSSEIGEDSDNDGLPDVWELQYGSLSDFDGRNGDADDDGISNWIEYKMGTDPTVVNAKGPGLYYQYDELGRIRKIERIPSR